MTGRCKEKPVFSQHGFTLIEIMVVCVLVGIVSSLAISNLVVNDDNAARSEAIKFAEAIDLIREESTLSGKKMSIGFVGPSADAIGGAFGRGYRFYIYQQGWQEYDDNFFHHTLFPDGISASLLLPPGGGDSIVIDPVGMISNFTASFLGSRYRYDIKINDELNVVVTESLLGE
ncbi:MAG: prepilin-type N-terminal cleavage/methylation domain-containing protein [Gammaproteobacteria bacterium]|nr:prepilin-type N-terminal cleavage/methylation domain-containing protein [Gammaproteobacteria bacterium]NKB62985.1 prepilin-type N-terminal cleavage/methylation domain-containing protein [Gammaproteobacteria bacterium]